jgi:hypothetical protein
LCELFVIQFRQLWRLGHERLGGAYAERAMAFHVLARIDGVDGLAGVHGGGEEGAGARPVLPAIDLFDGLLFFFCRGQSGLSYLRPPPPRHRLAVDRLVVRERFSAVPLDAEREAFAIAMPDGTDSLADTICRHAKFPRNNGSRAVLAPHLFDLNPAQEHCVCVWKLLITRFAHS